MKLSLATPGLFVAPAMFLCLMHPGMVHAAIVIELVFVPSDNGFPPGIYLPGEFIEVDVYARQIGSSNHVPIHYLLLDTVNSSPELTLLTPITEPEDGIHFWEFQGGCSSDCYLVDDDLQEERYNQKLWIAF